MVGQVSFFFFWVHQRVQTINKTNYIKEFKLINKEDKGTAHSTYSPPNSLALFKAWRIAHASDFFAEKHPFPLTEPANWLDVRVIGSNQVSGQILDPIGNFPIQKKKSPTQKQFGLFFLVANAVKAQLPAHARERTACTSKEGTCQRSNQSRGLRMGYPTTRLFLHFS